MVGANEVSVDRGVDLVASADADAVRSRQRRRRGIAWRLFTPGYYLDRHSPVVIGILLVTIFAGLAFVSVRGVGTSGPALPPETSGRQRGEWVEVGPMNPVEALVGRRYGRTVGLGSGGRPVVERADGGATRELTPLEMSFPIGAVAIEDPERPGVMLAPGGTGYGVWWEGTGPLENLPDPQVVDRNTWLRNQRRLLSQGLGDLSGALGHVGYTQPVDWSPGWGEHLELGTVAMRDYYAFGEPMLWNRASSRWHCSDALESDLTQGVTEGCPSSEHVASLAQVWAHLGSMTELLWGLGRAVRFEIELGSSDFSTVALQHEVLQDIYWELEMLGAARSQLEAVGSAEGGVVQVDLPEWGR